LNISVPPALTTGMTKITEGAISGGIQGPGERWKLEGEDAAVQGRASARGTLLMRFHLPRRRTREPKPNPDSLWVPSHLSITAACLAQAQGPFHSPVLA